MAFQTAAGQQPTEVPALHEIDLLLEQVALLARSDRTQSEFHAELLSRALRALAAPGGAIWVVAPGAGFAAAAQSNLQGPGATARLDEHPGHQALLKQVAQEGRSRVVPPGAAGPGADSHNPTAFTLLLAPVVADHANGAAAILEVMQHSGASPAAEQGGLELLEALCGLAAEYHRRERLRALEQALARQELFARFTESIHQTLDPNAMAFAVANEGRLYIGCDRLSVLLRHGRGYRVAAVSGIDVVDRRATVAALMPPLAKAVAATRQPFWSAGPGVTLAPQIARPLQEFLDASGSREVGVLPLCDPAADSRNAFAGSPPGVLLVESFSAPADVEALHARASAAARQARRAVECCAAHCGLPFYRLVRGLALARDRLGLRRSPRILMALAAAGGVAAVLFSARAEFTVPARGTLEPALRREVFAPADGVVREVRFDHLERCAVGDVLLVLERPLLEFEWTRVGGELQTARQRLASLEASRLQGNPQTQSERDRMSALTAEEEETRALVNGLLRQQALLRQQREELEVRSPIGGVITTFDVRSRLATRPVARGQALVQVADTAGPWQLEVDVADADAGELLRAQRALGEALDVTFVLATQPEQTYRGTIERVALATRVERGQAFVRVVVAIDAAQVPNPRPGATVLARIACGRRAVGAVWFHGLWQAVQKHLLF
jgi:multidrug resistance efflux pump